MDAGIVNTLTLSWENVTAWANPGIKHEKKKLLQNISGIARSGFLTAVLSPSGAGKTTLLAVLSRRFKGSVEGRILLNGNELDQEKMSNVSGFVCHKDAVIEYLTVSEHLNFTARMKMDRNLSEVDRRKRLLLLVENLTLTHRMNVQILSLSGGQRKRLSLATQLLTDPRILFCDEPTTGLDSFSAISVVKLLRSLADKGKTIICSIHQPASGIFELFDEVTLLASGGLSGYHGPVSEIQNYFSNLGMVCPENYSLSDFILSQVTIGPTTVERSRDDENRVRKIVYSFSESKIHVALRNELNAASRDKGLVNIEQKMTHVPIYIEFGWLLWRSSLQVSRLSKMWLLRFFLYIFVMSCLAFPYGIIWIDQTGVQNLQGFFHCLLMEIFYSSLYGVIYSVPEDLPIFVQETADKVYSPYSYYSAKLIILSTKAIIETFIYTNYALAVTGLNRNLNDYFLTGLPLILISLVSSAYGFFLSTAFDSAATFSLFSVPFEAICQIYGGLIVKLSSLPPITAWLKYLSIVFYAYEALAIQQWTKYDHISCYKADESECMYHNGIDVLESFSFSPDDLPLDYIGLVIYFLVLHSLSFFFLLRKLKTSAAY